jgi:hypothetical protein
MDDIALTFKQRDLAVTLFVSQHPPAWTEGLLIAADEPESHTDAWEQVRRRDGTGAVLCLDAGAGMLGVAEASDDAMRLRNGEKAERWALLERMKGVLGASWNCQDCLRSWRMPTPMTATPSGNPVSSQRPTST